MRAMTVKQRAIRAVVTQFHRPHGIGGRAAAWVMAHRSSNRERSLWAVGLLDVQPGERVLELGFGPGVAIGELARQAGGGLVAGVDHSELMVRQARPAQRHRGAGRGGRSAPRRHRGPPRLRDRLRCHPRRQRPPLLRRPGRGTARASPAPSVREAGSRSPRSPAVPVRTAETSAESGRQIAARLEAAGFSDVRVETLPLDPPVVCASAWLGVRERGTILASPARRPRPDGGIPR